MAPLHISLNILSAKQDGLHHSSAAGPMV